ncbi:alpha-2-macroglobulin family protein [Spongiimicrobium sp. 3-5]|uniref:alpha-2-macroglobulin family protein n=1 Tax=Spongiimicrobium sp. 3-5 TaxID=3332596 RepID=UPI00397EF3CA
MKTRIATILMTFVLVLGCTTKKDDQIQFDNLNLYQDYIAEVSHGIISSKSDVRVVLVKPVNAWSKGDELDKDLLRVSPKVDGKVVAMDERTIAFVPNTGFDQDTEYKVTLSLKEFVQDIPKELQVFTFGVKTLKQQFNVYTNPLQSYSRDWQYLEGQIRSSDQLNLKTVTKLVQATHSGKSIDVKFDKGIKQGTLFQFKIDSIPRAEEDSDLKIVWDGSSFDIESSGENSIKVPGKNNFTVLNITVDSGTDDVVSINFSDPLKKGQEFKGLVVLEGADNPRFSVSGNTLKLYPSQEIKGTAQLEVFEGIQSNDGYKLKTKFTERVAFESLKPQVRMLSNGTLLPSSHNLKINFEAVGLKAVDVSVFKIFENNILQFLQENNLDGNYGLRKVARPIVQQRIDLEGALSKTNGKWVAHALDLKSLMRPEVGAMYRVELNYRPAYSLYTCEGTNFETEVDDTTNFDEEIENSFWDGSENYYNDYYGYDWNERENPCHTSYYYDKKTGVNLLATDLGVTIKKGNNKSYFVAVNDVLNTNPVAGAKVTFYNYQQQPLGQVVTDADGTSVFDAETSAYFAQVENNGQKTYVKLNDGNALSMSKFNVSGVQLEKGVKGFIFGERGIWRPGDKLFLSFMLNDNDNKLPPNHPVKLELMDPYNKVVHREVTTNGLNNFYHFTVQTNENAPTGNWLAKVSIGGISFTKTIKIETIKPNRLKIKANLGGAVLSGSKTTRGTLEVKWLHGAVAKNLKTDVSAKFSSQTTSFTSYPAYVFDDPTRGFSMEDQIIFKGNLNEEGTVDFSVNPQLKASAPGMLNAAFITKVYENGGDFSTDVFTKPYSPFKTYVGLNSPKGDKTRSMLLTDVNHKFEVVTLGENGSPKATKNLKVTVHKVNWRWWWDTSADNLSSFSSSNYREKVFEKTINTNAKGEGSFNFELKYPNWGRYLVRVEDPNGGHATGKAVYIDWPGWAGKSRKGDPSAASMLTFSTDKETYTVGETATVTIPSSEDGRALITVENGSEVLHSLWMETQKGETKFQLPITALYTPNVYINITLLQPHAATTNDLPMRLYGVAPISVEDPSTKLTPLISMPNVLRPEETITLKINEKDGRSMTYSIALVDEGLLDLTRFKTPNPWNTFYAHEALGVKTWDVYDDIIGAFGGRIDQVFAIGGDGELAGAKNKKANRFKPMVVHLGPFELKEGATKSHKIKVPKYVGSVRTMVVAGNVEKDAYGMAEKTTAVRKPLMVLASLPRKITPREKVVLPITVFAMEKKVKNVSVKIRPHKSFKIIGSATQQLSFTQPDEKMVYFNLEVADFKGIGNVVVEATGNGEKASFEVPIDVVNPNPVTTSVEHMVLEANEERTISLETFGIASSNTAQIELSTLPPMNFNGRMQYLIRYPHGCVEQTTSAAFPQLFLADIFEVPSSKQNSIQTNVEQAIRRLGGYQLPNGGFSYWAGQNRANDWGTSFAGHFLLEAENKGYVLPIGFKTSWVSYQQQTAKQWRTDNTNADLAQAYRLYTLALSGNADVASMNRLRERATISNAAKYPLAAAYAIIGRAKVANRLLAASNFNFDGRHNGYTYGSSDRNRALALETFVLLNNKTKAWEMAKIIAQHLNGKNYMSTQTTAYSLLAMAKFAKMVGGKGIDVGITLNGNNQSLRTGKTLANGTLAVKQGANSLTLKNTSDNVVYASIIMDGILPVGREREEQRNLSARIKFKGRNGNNLDISKISQGTDFIAEVTVTNTTANEIKNLALTEIFPSGWEIVNTRFTDFGEFEGNKATYTDLRDDRANFYFDLGKNKSTTFRILLNASYLGTYYLPGIQIEAMYNNDYMLRTKGRWVEVVK